jgi:Putative auto-transporter adhesin, head GIN domain
MPHLPTERSAIRSLLAATALLAVAAVATGCTGAKGEGGNVAETRNLAAFERIETTFGIDVIVHIGPSQPIEVRAQSNILPLVTTAVEGGTLHITASQELNALVAVTVVISTPHIDGIALSGGADGTVTGFAGDRLEVTMSGGGDLTVDGTAEQVSIDASGGSEAHLSKLAIGTLDVELSGGSGVEARVSNEVRGSASGGAHVTVNGNARLNVQTSGGAQVGHS